MQGPGTKRIKIMGRGRTGMSFIRKSHLKLTLTEIDFDLAIASASSANQKAKWTKRRDAVTRSVDNRICIAQPSCIAPDTMPVLCFIPPQIVRVCFSSLLFLRRLLLSKLLKSQNERWAWRERVTTSGELVAAALRGAF